MLLLVSLLFLLLLFVLCFSVRLFFDLHTQLCELNVSEIQLLSNDMQFDSIIAKPL